MKGPITNQTFLTAARHTTHLTTGGKLPPLDLSKPWAKQPFGYKRIFDTKVAYDVIDDKGDLHVEKPGFFDISQQRLIAAIGQPIRTNGSTVQIGVSIGIAVAGPGRAEVDALVNGADSLMYQAKAEGKGRYRFSDTEPGPAEPGLRS